MRCWSAARGNCWPGSESARMAEQACDVAAGCDIGARSCGVGARSSGVGAKSFGVGAKSFGVGAKSFGVGAKRQAIASWIRDAGMSASRLRSLPPSAPSETSARWPTVPSLGAIVPISGTTSIERPAAVPTALADVLFTSVQQQRVRAVVRTAGAALTERRTDTSGGRRHLRRAAAADAAGVHQAAALGVGRPSDALPGQ